MAVVSPPRSAHARESQPVESHDRRPKFAPGDEFQRALRQRVEAAANEMGMQRRDCPRMYLKIGVVLATFALSYYLLVFVAQTWWQAVPLGLLLAMATTGIGFDIQHDGGHKAVSDRPWVNKLMAMTLDMVGGSSYIWRWKHVVFHHMYVNIHEHDTDIELGVFGRLCPSQPRRAIYRWQQWYLWPLYGVMAAKWHFYDDYRDVILGRMGANPFPRPRGWELAWFIGGKLLFMTLAIGIPLLFHPWWVVLIGYAAISWALGLFLSVVFQLAHAVEEAQWPVAEAGTGRIAEPWAVHQVGATVDFARSNRLVSWLVGGLNFQIEHHLFPTFCHVNYPAIAGVVEQTCKDFGVPYAVNPSFTAATLSHFRWLKRMGAG